MSLCCIIISPNRIIHQHVTVSLSSMWGMQVCYCTEVCKSSVCHKLHSACKYQSVLCQLNLCCFPLPLYLWQTGGDVQDYSSGIAHSLLHWTWTLCTYYLSNFLPSLILMNNIFLSINFQLSLNLGICGFVERQHFLLSSMWRAL